MATLLAMALMTAQCVRRFYETWFVSVFSNARMNFSHYIVGYSHYFGAICSILAEAPGFTPHAGNCVFIFYYELNVLKSLEWLPSIKLF